MKVLWLKSPTSLMNQMQMFPFLHRCLYCPGSHTATTSARCGASGGNTFQSDEGEVFFHVWARDCSKPVQQVSLTQNNCRLPCYHSWGLENKTAGLENPECVQGMLHRTYQGSKHTPRVISEAAIQNRGLEKRKMDLAFHLTVVTKL